MAGEGCCKPTGALRWGAWALEAGKPDLVVLAKAEGKGCRQGGLWPGRAVVREGCGGVHRHRKPASRVFLDRRVCAADKSGALFNVTRHLPIE